MATFVWTPKLAVGFDAMDDQHRQLIALMAALDEQIRQEAVMAECLATLDELGGLAVRHFADEERVMAEVGFPRLDHHCMLHATLLERFGDHRAEAARPQGRLTPAFSAFLGGWLTGHILGPDTQYGVYSGRLVHRGG